MKFNIRSLLPGALIPSGLLPWALAASIAAPLDVLAVTVVPGVSDTRIRLGMTATYKSGVGALATVADAMRATFATINAGGGVGGRDIELIVADDNMQAYRTKRIINKMVKDKMVLAVVGSVGGRTNSTAARILNERKVPHLFFSSWRGDLTSPVERPWSMTLVPHPQVAGAAIGRFIAANGSGTGSGEGQVAVLYPDGARFAERTIEGLARVLGESRLARHSFGIAIEELDAKVDALVGTAPSVVVNLTFGEQLVRSAAAIARDLPETPQVFGLDLWTSDEVAAVARDVGSGRFVVPSIVKLPGDASDDAAAFVRWRGSEAAKALASAGAAAVSYGYLTARLVEHVLRAADAQGLDRESVMRVARSMHDVRVPMLATGLALNTAPDNYNPVQRMVFRSVHDGRSSVLGIW